MREMSWQEQLLRQGVKPEQPSSSSSSSAASNPQAQLLDEIRQRKLQRDDAAAKNIQHMKSLNRVTLMAA